MNRREMLREAAGGAGAASVGLFAEGCGHQRSHPAAAGGTFTAATGALPDQAVIDNVLRKMDDRLNWINRQDIPSDMAPRRRSGAATADGQARFEKYDRLFRQSVRTLYVTGRFMDLPDEIKTHPDVQARVMAAQPEMDDAVLGTTELLESLTPDDHRAIQATLREHPRLGEQLAGLLETPAREDGIPFKRRMGVRTATLQVAERMSAQSPALTIDPQVRRVRRLTSQPHREDGAARIMAARMGEEAFWQHQQRLADLSAQWRRQLAQANSAGTRSAGPAGAARPLPPPPPAPSRGRQVVSRGGTIMGFGLASVGVGVLFAGLNAAFSTEAFLWPALIFGVTVGPILLMIGLIVAIVGLIMAAAA